MASALVQPKSRPDGMEWKQKSKFEIELIKTPGARDYSNNI